MVSWSLQLLPLVFFQLLITHTTYAFIPNPPAAPLHRPPPPSTRVALQATGVNVLYSEKFLDHKFAAGYHPENPLRVSIPAKVLATLQGQGGGSTGGDNIVHMHKPGLLTTPEEALAAIIEVHDAKYVEEIRALSARGGGHIDGDTYANAATFDVCLLATAAWIDCAKYTLQGGGASSSSVDGKRRPSFALTRPPGHHALRAQAMGFCLFNFCAITARYAINHLGCKRVAILDWDAHAGNGVSDYVAGLGGLSSSGPGLKEEEGPDICYATFHQKDAFPMTGMDPEDHGPRGNVLNIPLPAYSDMRTYLPLLEEKALPFLRSFEPDLVIVSAGYDSLVDDPLAQLALRPEDFGVFVKRLKEEFGSEKIMFGLEGGYEAERVAEAIVETLRPFLEEKG